MTPGGSGRRAMKSVEGRHDDPPQDSVCVRTRRARRHSRKKRRAWLTFVIVGAGATGLNFRALAEIARQTLRHDFRKIDPQKARII